MDKTELIKLELQNLFLIRNLLVQAIFLIVGGSIGLFFAEPTVIKIIFAIIGFILVAIFAACFIEISKKISKIIHKKEYKQ